MPDRTIRIGSLRLRVRGVSAADAKAAVHALGPELLQSLASEPRASIRNLPALKLGTVHLQAADAITVRNALVRSIADGLRQPRNDAQGGRQ